MQNKPSLQLTCDIGNHLLGLGQQMDASILDAEQAGLFLTCYSNKSYRMCTMYCCGLSHVS